MSHQLTPEQLALSLARKKKKEEAAAAAAAAKKQGSESAAYENLLKNPAARVLKREWLNEAKEHDGSTILVATWNVSLWLSPAFLIESTYFNLVTWADSRTDPRQCVSTQKSTFSDSNSVS